MKAERVERFAEGRIDTAQMTPGESAIEELVGRTARNPAALTPRDLEPLVARMGLASALEIVAMVGAFHYITRIADLTGVQTWLPRVARRRAWLRRPGLRLQAMLVRLGMDFSGREVTIDAAAELAEIERLRGRPLPSGYQLMLAAPSLAAYTRAMLSGLPRIERRLRRRVSRAVADALPAGGDQTTDRKPPSGRPLEALVRVATRRPAAVTRDLVDSVRRRHGWSDAELTDVFYLIAAFNDLERFDRLLGEAARPLLDPRPLTGRRGPSPPGASRAGCRGARAAPRSGRC